MPHLLYNKKEDLCYTNPGDFMDDLRIQLVDEVIAYFLNSDAFQAVINAEKAFEQPHHQQLIETYQAARSAYHATKKYGAHHPDLKSTQQAFQTAKAELFGQAFMQTYLKAYQTLQTELDGLSNDLAKTISSQISIGHLNVRL